MSPLARQILSGVARLYRTQARDFRLMAGTPDERDEYRHEADVRDLKADTLERDVAASYKETAHAQ